MWAAPESASIARPAERPSGLCKQVGCKWGAPLLCSAGPRGQEGDTERALRGNVPEMIPREDPRSRELGGEVGWGRHTLGRQAELGNLKQSSRVQGQPRTVQKGPEVCEALSLSPPLCPASLSRLARGKALGVKGQAMKGHRTSAWSEKRLGLNSTSIYLLGACSGSHLDQGARHGSLTGGHGGR